MDATPISRLPCWIETTLIDARSTTSYHDKYIAPVMESMCPADTFWILSNVCFFGRPLLWAICFFFGPVISDVISILQIMCQLTSISSYFIFTVIFVTLRYLRRLAPLQRVYCLTCYLVMTR